jgi:cytochrome P450
VTRTPNRHLTFGVGEHYCLGAALAQTEMTVFFEELTGRVAQIERAGPAARVRSNLVQGYLSAPAVLRPSR